MKHKATLVELENRVLTRPFKPHDYQKRAIQFLLQNNGAGLFLDPGLGKTAITLAALKILKNEGFLGKVLIVAPLRVIHLTWPAELAKWKEFCGVFKHVTLHGPDKNELVKRDADLYFINYEGLPWLMEKHPSFVAEISTFIADESTRLKNWSAKRVKMLRPFLPKIPRRWILTGTPASNGLLDLFSQLYIVDLGRALGRYITHYRDKYFYPSGYGGYDWKPIPGMDKEIFRRIAPVAMRLSAKEYLELPEEVTVDIEVELPESARETYKEMERHLFAEIEGKAVMAASAAAALNKCLQITGGAVYDADKKTIAVHEAKLDALDDLIEEMSGTPLLVAFWFQHEAERFREKYGKNTPILDGRTTAGKARELVRAWNEGELPVLFAQPASAGHGLNLQGTAAHICWYSPTWDLELMLQFNGRVIRQGQQATRVIVHRLICRDTVDELVWGALAGKDAVQKKLFKALKARSCGEDNRRLVNEAMSDALSFFAD